MGKIAIITGVNGQDGSLLADFLVRKEYEIVIGIQRRTSSPTDWRLKELGIYKHKNFKACSGDITDPGSIDRIVSEYQPNEFYHLAAQSFVSESWQSPSLTHQINTVGTINCLESIRNNKLDCKFYFAGSSEQFGGKCETKILNENTILHP
jgi:GDPmannose 4,6-dehydratase